MTSYIKREDSLFQRIKKIFKYLFNNFLRNKEKQYKPIQVKFKTTYPDNYSTNTFAYLEKEYKGRIMKRFMD